MTVTTAGSEEAASPTVVSDRPGAVEEDLQDAAPSPAWGRQDVV